MSPLGFLAVLEAIMVRVMTLLIQQHTHIWHRAAKNIINMCINMMCFVWPDNMLPSQAFLFESLLILFR